MGMAATSSSNFFQASGEREENQAYTDSPPNAIAWSITGPMASAVPIAAAVFKKPRRLHPSFL